MWGWRATSVVKARLTSSGEPLDLTPEETLLRRPDHLLVEELAPSYRGHPGPLRDQAGRPDEGLIARCQAPSFEEPPEPLLLIGMDPRGGVGLG